MSWARNLPLSRKFTYAFGIVCALCLVLGIYTLLDLPQHRAARMQESVRIVFLP